MINTEAMDLIKDVLKQELNAITTLENNFPLDAFVKVVNYIKNELTGKIIVTGLGKSGDVGKRLANTLTSTGTRSVYLHCTEASHGDMGIIADDDLVIAISNSGETKEMSDVINYTRRFGIKLVAICANPNSMLGTHADINLTIPDLPEACLIGKAPTISIILLTTMANLLIVALEKAKGFTSDMYKNWHPHGKLGASLLKVSELMHVGEELPLVKETALMNEVFDVMSRKVRFGCVGVVDTDGRLVGIFTDGDIRRRLSEGVDLMHQNISEVMGKSPKTITSDSLAATALLKINESKIQALFVVNSDNKPVGIINFHDLLKAGLV
ncbi:MAG: KpsF/GutQ family sugar-phosphate isomerase [Alphaproteobacteria bacterium]|nr:KpsF/GutQ family sugar-phosphate isomerase [Alphaproteobacteria bacterium]